MRLKSKSTFCFGLLIVFFSAGELHAQEYALLAKFPAQLLERLRGASANPQGLIPATQKIGFIDPQMQRDGMTTLLVGAVLGNEAWVQEGFRVADATFAAQNPDGSIGFSKGYTETSDSMFLYSATRAMIVLRESPLGPKYGRQVDKYIPAISRTLNWLMQPPHINALVSQSGTAPNRDINIAISFASCRKLLGQSPWSSTSEDFLKRAFALFRPQDGVFIEESTKQKISEDLQTNQGGGDSSYEAASLLYLDELYAVYGRQEALTPLQLGIRWELTKVQPNGQISVEGNSRTGLGQEQLYGHSKDVNYNEVLEALQLYCVIFNDNNVCNAASAVSIYRFHH